jgi:hypothetical protein
MIGILAGGIGALRAVRRLPARAKAVSGSGG